MLYIIISKTKSTLGIELEVSYLIKKGVKPSRLSAAGFGEFQPLDDGRDEISNRRNRRIEIKLTQRYTYL